MFMKQEQPTKFNIKVYKGDNSINLIKADSGMLGLMENRTINDKQLIVSNVKQFISYHFMRIVSESFRYFDPAIYNIITNYINNLYIESYLYKDGGETALKFNLIGEFYKINILLQYYGKKLLKDINIVEEEIDALISKLYKSIK